MQIIVYHQADNYTHFVWWDTTRQSRVDDIQPDGWWYAIAFAMDKKIPSPKTWNFLEATIGFEPMNQGFADPRLTTWLCRRIDFFEKNRTQETGRILCPVFYGADDEARTRYLHLGKVALYQMSYIRIQWCLRSESNQWHEDFQSSALPTELQRQKMATRNGLEPSTSSVTG